MKQGLLAFQYEQEKSSTGMTALSGLMTYLELMQAAGLRSSVERHVRLRERGQGWTDSQMIISLMLLNLAGGESVSDLDLLEKDEGLSQIPHLTLLGAVCVLSGGVRVSTRGDA